MRLTANRYLLTANRYLLSAIDYRLPHPYPELRLAGQDKVAAGYGQLRPFRGFCIEREFRQIRIGNTSTGGQRPGRIERKRDVCRDGHRDAALDRRCSFEHDARRRRSVREIERKRSVRRYVGGFERNIPGRRHFECRALFQRKRIAGGFPGHQRIRHGAVTSIHLDARWKQLADLVDECAVSVDSHARMHGVAGCKAGSHGNLMRRSVDILGVDVQHGLARSIHLLISEFYASVYDKIIGGVNMRLQLSLAA